MPHSASAIINAHSNASGSHPAIPAVCATSEIIIGLPDTRFGFVTFDAAAAGYRTPGAKPEGLVKMRLVARCGRQARAWSGDGASPKATKLRI